MQPRVTYLYFSCHNFAQDLNLSLHSNNPTAFNVILVQLLCKDVTRNIVTYAVLQWKEESRKILKECDNIREYRESADMGCLCIPDLVSYVFSFFIEEKIFA